MAYAIVRTDLMSGTTQPADLVSVRYQSSDVDAPIENGNIVKVGKLLAGERNIFVATAPEKDTSLTDLALIATPEVLNDERKRGLGEFRNEAGENSRGYFLRSKNIFSVTKEALTGIPAKDSLVELEAGKTKLKVVTAATASTTTVGTIIDIEGDYIVIQLK